MAGIDITQGEAIEIFKHIRSFEYGALEKRKAIKMVARMPDVMLNKVTKAELMEVIRWEQNVIK